MSLGICLDDVESSACRLAGLRNKLKELAELLAGQEAPGEAGKEVAPLGGHTLGAA